MRETTKQTLAILGITFLLGISLFIFLKFTKPAFDNLNSLKADIADKTEIKNELAKRKQTVIAISEQYASMGDVLNKIREALPSKPQLAQVLAAIDSVARTSSVIINDISFRELAQTKTDTKNANQYNTIEVSFSLEGNFVNTKAFLAEIEKELRIMDVQQVNMNQYNSLVQTGTKTKTVKSVSTLKTDVILYTYYQP
jgi:Tfp pilus assembly protein PilO